MSGSQESCKIDGSKVTLVDFRLLGFGFICTHGQQPAAFDENSSGAQLEMKCLHSKVKPQEAALVIYGKRNWLSNAYAGLLCQLPVSFLWEDLGPFGEP